jgi:3-dehydroquinate synthase
VSADELVTVEVELALSYPVVIGPAALEGAREELAREAGRGRRVALLCDRRVAELHATRLAARDAFPRLALEGGEACKDLAHLEAVLDFLAGARMDRGGLLVTLGGGALSDLGGLAAALYMRGIDVVHCPTTLLAQVDAAIGGKTAVNLRAGKNLAGCFHQPRAVYADTSALATLDEADFRSGLGEVVKSAWIAGEAALEQLEGEAAALVRRDPAALARCVVACVRTKAAIVARDPEERGEHGERAVLNLGHTFAHALEHAAGFGGVPHGAAVAVGLILALECSAELGLLADKGWIERTRRLLAHLGLATTLAELAPGLDPRRVRSAMALDKKSRAGGVRLVLPRAPGRIELGVEPPSKLLDSVVAPESSPRADPRP